MTVTERVLSTILDWLTARPNEVTVTAARLPGFHIATSVALILLGRSPAAKKTSTIFGCSLRLAATTWRTA